MKIVCISDTHGLHDFIGKIPKGDILIHSGDMCNTGYGLHEVENFADWLQKIKNNYKKIIVIAGNHDRQFENYSKASIEILSQIDNLVYLKDELYEYQGLRIYGSPWLPMFCNWAFNLNEKQLYEIWEDIPENLDILITHCPPFNILDVTEEGSMVGSISLSKHVHRVKPKYHLFGHIHEANGIKLYNDTTYLNISSVDRRYKFYSKPYTIVEI